MDLEVLDLTTTAVREHLDIDENDLCSDDYTTTQAVAAAARDAGFDGVLAPAASLPNRQTLAVFAHALPKSAPSDPRSDSRHRAWRTFSR